MSQINLSTLNYSVKPKHYFGSPRPEMLEFVPKNTKTLLDVGCGSGQFLNMVKSNIDCEIWGIELEKSAGEMALEFTDKVFLGTIEENLDKMPRNCFDCVSFNDVLEHLADPYSILKKTKNLLTADGVIVVSIPNVRFFKNLYRYLILKDWKYEDEGILDRTHLRFFTQKSIVEMCDSLGFEIINIKGINPSKDWKVRIFNLLTLGFFSDCMFLQFGVTIKPKLSNQK